MELPDTRTPTRTRTLTGHQRVALRTLLYFDVFHHPLRIPEIERYSCSPVDLNGELASALAGLVDKGHIQHHDGFYGLGDVRTNIAVRIEGNERARRSMAKARRMSRFIGRFPYVRAVMLSGSISKGCLAADGDIDYFVITEPGRLWMARTLLIAFKKLFLFNSRRHFCVNYFVDLDHLAIEDRNLFTATEVLTLVPTYGPEVCNAFFTANTWAHDHLPHAGTPEADDLQAARHPIKRLLERMLAGGMGDEIDEWCMLRTMKHWRGKFAEFDREKFELALRTRKYVSKHHPRNFQQRVLDAYGERIHHFERTTGLKLA